MGLCRKLEARMKIGDLVKLSKGTSVTLGLVVEVTWHHIRNIKVRWLSGGSNLDFSANHIGSGWYSTQHLEVL